MSGGDSPPRGPGDTMPMRQTDPTVAPLPVMEAERSEKPEWWDSLFVPTPEAPAPVEHIGGCDCGSCGVEAAPVPVPVENKTRKRYKSRLLSKKQGYHSHPRPTYDQMAAAKKNKATGGSGCPICGLPASRCRWWAMNGG